ncbi:MAG TPA: hypothetical protein VFG30_10165 [Polyangiales bacterium]|nr:hypothetical protein [Polyangiales bacterium]
MPSIRHWADVGITKRGPGRLERPNSCASRSAWARSKRPFNLPGVPESELEALRARLPDMLETTLPTAQRERRLSRNQLASQPPTPHACLSSSIEGAPGDPTQTCGWIVSAVPAPTVRPVTAILSPHAQTPSGVRAFDLYWLMSTWNTYRVVVMRSRFAIVPDTSSSHY